MRCSAPALKRCDAPHHPCPRACPRPRLSHPHAAHHPRPPKGPRPLIAQPCAAPPRRQVCSRIDAIEGATALRELPGPEAVLIGERPDCYSSSVETLPISGFEAQASPVAGRPERSPSPGEKRKCSDVAANSSQSGGATVIVVNMVGAASDRSTAPERPTPQSPEGSPKGTELKRPKSVGSNLATVSLGPSAADARSDVDGEAPASRDDEAKDDGLLLFTNGFDLKRPKSVDSNLASWSASALRM